MAIFRWLLALVIIAFVIVLSFENGAQVEFSFVGHKLAAPLILMLFTAFAVGVLGGLFASIIRIGSLKRQIRKQRKQLEAAQKQLDLQNETAQSNLSETSLPAPDPEENTQSPVTITPVTVAPEPESDRTSGRS